MSPKRPWGEFQVVDEPERRPLIDRILLWVPNRILDFIDIFRVDVGAGMSTGGVVRVSKYVQAGYRSMHPASVRVGDFGRQAPYLVEHSNEFGVSPFYVDSHDRKVCPGEVGVGLDIVVVGGYAGICVDEAFDFLAGLFFWDVKDDDLQ